MRTTHFFFLTAVYFVASCQRSGLQADESSSFGSSVSVSATQLEFEASTAKGSTSNAFGASGAAVSRATETAFQPNDRIGLYIHTAAAVGATGDHSSNVPYRYDGAWRAAGSLAALLVEGTAYKVTAYSPYKQGLSDATQIYHEVEADQSSVAGSEAGPLERGDFMTSAVATMSWVGASSPKTPQASLAFTHALAKFVVTFSVPEELDGAEVTGLTSIAFKGIRRDCVVNLATGAVSPSAAAVVSDVLPRRTSAGEPLKGTTVFYEAIVPPQTFSAGKAVVELSFATAGGNKELTYAVPAGGSIALNKNQKYTLTLSSIADLAFVTELPSALLLDGLAHTDVELKIKSKTAWKLTSPNAWLRVKTTGAYGQTATGAGSEAEQTVLVDLVANASAVLARSAVLALESTTDPKVKATYTVNQNYFSYTNTQAAWSPDAGAQAQAIAAMSGNQLIRIWSDEGAANGAGGWLQVAGSGTYGEGDPQPSVDVVGTLNASSLWLQAGVNNTSADRTTTVRYTPVDASGALVRTQEKTQAAASVVVTPVALAAGPSAMADHTLFTVTAPTGVRWKLSELSGADAAHFTGLTPAAGAEQTSDGSAVAVKVSAAAVAQGEVKRAALGVVYALASTPNLQTADINISHGMFVSLSDGSDWLNQSKDGASKTITVNLIGASQWTAVVDGGDGVFVNPSTGTDGTTVTIGWSPNVTASAKTNRVIKFYPTGYPDVAAKINTSQQAGPAIININGVKWATGYLIASGPNSCVIGTESDCGVLFNWGSLVGFKNGSLARNGDGVGPVVVTSTTWSGGSWTFANECAVSPIEMTVPWPATSWTLKYNSGTTNSHGWTRADLRPSTDMTESDPTRAVGDACTYYLGPDWSLPTFPQVQATFPGVPPSATGGTAPMPTGWAFSGTNLRHGGSGAMFRLVDDGRSTPPEDIKNTNIFFPYCRTTNSGGGFSPAAMQYYSSRFWNRGDGLPFGVRAARCVHR